MKNYVKPMIMLNEELAEGVFAASGSVPNCMTVEWLPGTRSEVRNGNEYLFNGEFKYNHVAYDHCNKGCYITVIFPCAVTLYPGECTQGIDIDGNGTSVIKITIHNPLHAAGNSYEKSTITVTGFVSSSAERSLVYSATTCTITDVGLQDKDCPTHSHMFK